MSYDGSLIFDTKIDNSGMESGLKTIGSIGVKAATAFTAAIAAGGAAAIKVGSDFEAAMSQVAAVSGATGAEFETLTQKAEEMGAKTKFTAAESAEALNYMAMAGWKTKDMLDGVEGIMNLAAASGENLALVSDIVTDAMTAFGLSAEQSGHFADVLAAAASNSNTNVGMMGATFKYVAPIAGAMKYSIEDTAVAIGLMANAGIKGEQAGTSLRAMLTRLVDPPSDAAAAMDTLNLSIENSNGSMRPLGDVLEQLREKFAGMSESQKASTASALAGTEAMSGLLAIVNASDADFDALTASIANADGTALKMSETMQDNLQGSLTILSSSMEGFGIAIYDKFADPTKKAVNSAIESVNRLTASMKEGELGKSVDAIAESFGSFLDTAATLAEKTLPMAIELTAEILEHAREIATVLAAIQGAKYGLKFVTALNKVTAAWKVAATAAYGYQVAAASANRLELGNMLATTAQVASMGKGFATAAKSASLLTAGKVALKAAIAALGGPMTATVVGIGAITAGLGVWLATGEKMVDQLKVLTENIHKEAEAYQELYEKQTAQAESSVAEIDHTKRLWQELKTLVNENGRVIGSKERAKFITDEINKIAPGTIKWISDERIEYEKNAKAIDELLDKKRAQIIVDSQEPLYREAVLKYKEKENEQAEIAIELAKTQEELDKKRADGINSTLDSNIIVDLENKMKSLSGAYKENEGTLKSYYNNIAVYEANSAAILEGNSQKIKAINNTTTESFKYATNTTEEELLKQVETTQANLLLMQQRFRDGYAGVTQSMITEAGKAADAAVREYKKVGTASVDGYVAGINGSKDQSIRASKSWAQSIIDAVKATFQTHSPSVVFRDEIGKNLALGLELGFTDSLDDIYRRMQSAVNEQTSRLSASVLVSTGYPQQINAANSTTGKTGNIYNITNNATIDPSNLAEMNQVIKIFKGEQQSIRMGFVGG